jgi:hypothetical protein
MVGSIMVPVVCLVRDENFGGGVRGTASYTVLEGPFGIPHSISSLVNLIFTD